MRAFEKIGNFKKIRHEELRSEIILGVEDLRNKKSQTFNSGEEVFEEIRKRGRRKLLEKIS